MQKIKSSYAKAVVLSLALMLSYGIANAQCTTQIGNYSTCTGPRFLSISSSSCEAGYYGSSQFTITITVNQTGASYNAYPGYGATLVSSSVSGTTLTYVIQKASGTSSTGLAVHMASPCDNNFVSITIE
jgi:hypothetical protein